MAVNLKGPFFLIQALLPILARPASISQACRGAGSNAEGDSDMPRKMSGPARLDQDRASYAKLRSMRVSMLSRRGASDGVVGSSKAEWGVKRARPSVADS